MGGWGFGGGGGWRVFEHCHLMLIGLYPKILSGFQWLQGGFVGISVWRQSQGFEGKSAQAAPKAVALQT